jgi:C-terminal processing protease CtpA/Prc
MNYKHKGDGVLIDEIINGGPLDKASFNITAGMLIEKIDGITVDHNQDVAKYLNRKAWKFMLLDVLDPKTKKQQTITVKQISIGQENRLLYNRWVKTNEDEVEKLSNGQLGYVLTS